MGAQLTSQGIILPAGTTAQRPTAAAGQLRYSTTFNHVESPYNGATWRNVSEPTVWVRFNGSTGAIYNYGGAYSSISRVGTGRFTLTFSRAMSNANYLWYCDSDSNTFRSGNTTGPCTGNSGGYWSISTTSITFQFAEYSTMTLTDTTTGYFAVWEAV